MDIAGEFRRDEHPQEDAVVVVDAPADAVHPVSVVEGGQ